MSATLTDAIRKTVLVDVSPAEAFELFTARIHTWWPTTSHSHGGAEVTDVVFEQRQGGRVSEVTPAGERDWAPGDGEARGNFDSGWDVVLAPFAAAAKR